MHLEKVGRHLNEKDYPSEENRKIIKKLKGGLGKNSKKKR